MTQGKIAQALGIGERQVRRLARRGMPTHSAAAARRWRTEHLDHRYMVVEQDDSPDDDFRDMLQALFKSVLANPAGPRMLSGWLRVELGATKERAIEFIHHLAVCLRCALDDFAGEQLDLELPPQIAEAFRDPKAWIAAHWPDE